MFAYAVCVFAYFSSENPNLNLHYRWTGDAPGSVSQPKIAFSPCSSDCNGKCVDSCPDYCCVQTIKSKTSDQSNQVGVTAPASQVRSVTSITFIGDLEFLIQGIKRDAFTGEFYLSKKNCN